MVVLHVTVSPLIPYSLILANASDPSDVHHYAEISPQASSPNGVDKQFDGLRPSTTYNVEFVAGGYPANPPPGVPRGLGTCAPLHGTVMTLGPTPPPSHGGGGTVACTECYADCNGAGCTDVGTYCGADPNGQAASATQNKCPICCGSKCLGGPNDDPPPDPVCNEGGHARVLSK
jgi:hypothetical protein